MNFNNFFRSTCLLMAVITTNLLWSQTPPPTQSQNAVVLTTSGGVGNVITIPDDPLLDIANPNGFTFEGWFNICNAPAIILNKHFCAAGGGQAGYFLLLDPNGYIRFHFESTGNCTGADFNFTGPPIAWNDNNWHHISLRVQADIVNGTTDVDVRIDGNVQINQVGFPLIPFTNARQMYIGAYENSNSNFSMVPNGRFDEFRFYNAWIPDNQLMLDVPNNTVNMAHYEFEPPLVPSSNIPDAGNQALNATYNNVNVNINNQTPTPSNAVYAISDITINHNSSTNEYCTGDLITLDADYGDDSPANPNLSYTWQYSTDNGVTWSTMAGTGNTNTLTPNTPGNYLILVSTSVTNTGCDEIGILEVLVSNCCIAATSPNFVHIPDGTVISTNSIWGGSMDKYYVEGTVTVSNATLDITNCDVVFSTTGEIIVNDGGFIRSTNSVFRPCELTDSWMGIDFTNSAGQNNASGAFNECIFKNALTALDITTIHDTYPVSITNNLFKNCETAVVLNNGNVYGGNISGNTFEVDLYEVIDQSGIPTVISNFIGIQLTSTSLISPISQNNFVNVDAASNTFVGINAIDGASAEITQNNFSDCQTAIFGNNSTLHVLNNEFNITYSIAPLAPVVSQIHVEGTGGVYRVVLNEIVSTGEYLTNFNTIGIDADNTNNLEVNANHVEGFSWGIDLYNTTAGRVYENTVVNSLRWAINTELSTDLSISCNTINGQYDSGAGISYFNTTSSNNDEISSNCIFDTHLAIGVDDLNNVSGVPPFSPLPDIKNNYLYNYRNQGISVGYMVGSIGVPGTPGRNSFFSNNNSTSVDIECSAAVSGLVTADENFNLTNPGTNMIGYTTTANIYNSTASCGHQEDINNNQSLYNGEACYKAAPFTVVVPLVEGNLTLDRQNVSTYIEENGLENSFYTIMMLANFQNEWDEQLKNELRTSIEPEFKNELDFYIGILENDPAVYTLIGTSGWSFDKELYLKGLYELRFDGELSTITRGEMNDYIANTEGQYRNKFIALLTLDSGNLVRPYIINKPKEPVIVQSETGVLPEGNNGFEIYPNPAEDEISLNYIVEDLEGGEYFRIYDSNGRLVLEKPITYNAATTRIDISHLNNGVYYIEMIFDDTKPSLKEKFIKM